MPSSNFKESLKVSTQTPSMAAYRSVFLIFLSSIGVVVASTVPCTTCIGGAEVGEPDKLLDMIPNLPPLDCRTMAELVPVLLPDSNSPECQLMHRLSTLCGCPRKEDACVLCPDGSNVTAEFEYVEVPELAFLFGSAFEENFAPTCEVVEALGHATTSNSTECAFLRAEAAEMCGCPAVANLTTGENITIVVSPDDIMELDLTGFSTDIHGATTEQETLRHARIARTTGIISIVAAFSVIVHTLIDRPRRSNTYNQIIVLMAIFDIIAGIAYSLTDIPRPADDSLVSPGERGTQATCVAQGWFTIWGVTTSLYFNGSLAMHYVLVVVHAWTASKLKKARKWILGIPLVSGLVAAMVSIPFITYAQNGCSIAHPATEFLEEIGVVDFNINWGAHLGLITVPGYLIIFGCTLSMIRVYWFVYQTDRRSQRWDIHQAAASGNTQDCSPRVSLTRRVSASFRRSSVSTATARLRSEVAWQSLLYLTALYATWGFLLTVSSTLVRFDYLTSHYKLWSFYFFILPLQGFMNALVYYRPHASRQWKVYTMKRKARKKAAAARKTAQQKKPDEEDSGEEHKEEVQEDVNVGTPPKDRSRLNDIKEIVEPEIQLVMLNAERDSQQTTQSGHEGECNDNDDDQNQDGAPRVGGGQQGGDSGYFRSFLNRFGNRATRSRDAASAGDGLGGFVTGQSISTIDA